MVVTSLNGLHMISQCVAGIVHHAIDMPPFEEITEDGKRNLRGIISELLLLSDDKFSSELERRKIFQKYHHLANFPANILYFNDVCYDTVSFIRKKNLDFLKKYTDEDFKNFLQMYTNKAIELIMAHNEKADEGIIIQ